MLQHWAEGHRSRCGRGIPSRSGSSRVTNLGKIIFIMQNPYLLSCTVAEIWLIIGQIFASDRGSLHFNAFDGVIPCEYPDKLYLYRN